MEQKAQHIAIIMDGNGRWATQRGQNRTFGHAEGVERVREIIRESSKLKLKALTLYTFSTENWQRPEFEVSFIMKLLLVYLRSESKEIIDNNIVFHAIGFTEMLPKEIQAEAKRLEKLTEKNTGMHLHLAISYGSRQELTRAVKLLAKKVRAGELEPEEITEELISQNTFTSHVADPDLLIRTGGDKRISNFLLWQCAYTELYFTDLYWPDFTIPELHKAMDEFSRRQRRFGKVLNESTNASGN